jgi:hypothetical protein
MIAVAGGRATMEEFPLEDAAEPATAEEQPKAYIRGLPHPLPVGERVLWEGAPGWRAVATHVFHWRLFAGYFAAMLLLWLVTTELAVGTPVFLAALGLRLGLIAVALGIVVGLARAVARTTWYAITSERVVLRIGMVLPMSINLPFRLLESAGVGQFRDGTGQIALRLVKGERLAYIALWPHCRVFQLNHPQPLLRGLDQPAPVADLLRQAVAASTASASGS